MEAERRLSAERDAPREAFENTQARLELQAIELARNWLNERKAIEMIAQSRWVRLGRVVKVGPEIRRN